MNGPNLAPPSTPSDDPPRVAPPLPATGREITRALGLVFGATALLLVAQILWPPLAGVSQLGLALVLFQAPWWVLPRDVTPTGAGCTFTIGPVLPGLALSFGVMAIVFPLFVGGFHIVYTQVLDRPSDWDLTHVTRWNEDFEYAPANVCGRNDVVAWTQQRSLWVMSPKHQDLVVASATTYDARRVICQGVDASVRAPLPVRPDGTWLVPAGQGVQFDLQGVDSFVVQLRHPDGTLFAADSIRVGSRGVAASDDGRLAASRDAWWLLAFILIQLGLVALPEEHFFRGYLQSRLDVRWGTRWSLFGARVGWGFIAASAAFALLHPILIPGPHRLLVFFPSLLFGWLRARQGHLGAAIAVHAGSNLLLAIVGRMYG